MAPYAQSTREFRFDCGLGDDALVVESFTMEEAVSRPFRLVVDLVSEDAAVSHKDVLEKKATLTIGTHEGPREVHGIVSRFTQLGQTRVPGSEKEITHYRAEIVPKLWLLGLRSDTRAFQAMSVPDIVKKVLKDAGLATSEYDIVADGAHPVREFCVQYQESDLQFVSRLLEEEGFFYFFDHGSDGCKMHIADATRVFAPCPGVAEATMRPAVGESYDLDVVHAFSRERVVHTNVINLGDYNFEIPTTRLDVAEHPSSSPSGATLETFEYPAGYLRKPRGEEIARVRIEEAEALTDVASGSGSVRSFLSGHTFKLGDHYQPAMDGEYVLLQVRHHGRAGSLARIGGQDEYWNEFTCIPKATKFRPARVTPRPRVFGSQTAMVTGPSGEEIHVDQYGRVKVRFHWDRKAKNDDKSSCWVRVASVWAGNGFGFHQTPRIGDEVIVDFLEGDPDRPIITGRVYNAQNAVPWALPDNQTCSGIKTSSSKGNSGFNELRFEDKAGHEEVFFQAQKDHKGLVKNNETWEVGNDQTLTVDHDRTKHVKRDETTTIDRNRTETVQGDESITIGKTRTENVASDETVTLGKNRTVTIAENDTQTIGKTLSLTIGENATEVIGKDHTVEVGGNEHFVVGKNLIIQAGDEIVLKCGQSEIVMKKDGTILIKGNDIGLKASADMAFKAGASVSIKGSAGVKVKTEAELSLEGSAAAALKSTGITQVQGTMVKIN